MRKKSTAGGSQILNLAAKKSRNQYYIPEIHGEDVSLMNVSQTSQPDIAYHRIGETFPLEQITTYTTRAFFWSSGTNVIID